MENSIYRSAYEEVRISVVKCLENYVPLGQEVYLKEIRSSFKKKINNSFFLGWKFKRYIKQKSTSLENLDELIRFAIFFGNIKWKKLEKIKTDRPNLEKQIRKLFLRNLKSIKKESLESKTDFLKEYIRTESYFMRELGLIRYGFPSVYEISP